MSKLHIDVDAADKALWVACASHSGTTLAEWITAAANEAARRNPPPPPKWMRDAGFSQRLADCLIRDGLARRSEFEKVFAVRSDEEWLSLQNFGRGCLQELREKWLIQ